MADDPWVTDMATAAHVMPDNLVLVQATFYIKHLHDWNIVVMKVFMMCTGSKMA